MTDADSQPIAPPAHLGFIGLGIMGAPMAGRLLDAGFRMTVYNRTREKAQPLGERGATVVDSPEEVAAAGPTAVCLNVTDAPDVEAIVFGDEGVVHAMKPGLIVVDHSTISPLKTQAMASRLAQVGGVWVDAPVSGGDVGAKQGTLSVMVGGQEKAVSRLGPIFDVVGQKRTHLGEAGAGQACKACNQIAVSLNLMGVCEAIALARASGLPVERMLEAVSGGAAGSWQMSNLGPKIAAGDYEPGFMIEYVLKDLSIVTETAQALQLSLDGAALARRRFEQAAEQGAGREGTQAMAKAVGRREGKGEKS